MECIVLAENAAKRQEIAWALEDLGADWRCAGAATAEQALLLLAQRPAMLAVLSACPEAAAFARQLEARPLLAPPYLLGDGFPAADGRACTDTKRLTAPDPAYPCPRPHR